MNTAKLTLHHTILLLLTLLGAALLTGACVVGAPGTIRQDALSEEDGIGGHKPFLSCADDGICNIAICSLNDPDCIAENCNQDGRCNSTCASDPDCPAPKTCDRGEPFTATQVTTSCGKTAFVRSAASDPLVQARVHIEAKWPNFRVSKDLHYDDDNDQKNEGGETCWREGHAEANLVGFGVSLTHADHGPLGGCTDPVWGDLHAGKNPNRPSLLFFEKTTGDKDQWRVIGAGYHYAYTPCSFPCLTGVSESDFIIHEAGWHRVPGDGGFTCIEQPWVDNSAGLQVSDQCAVIEKDDFHRSSIAFGANKHERLWTLHLFFDPTGNGVAVAATDPWCRDQDDPTDEPVVTTSCSTAFYERTQQCACQ